MPVVFFLNKLRDGASADDYERWIREVDYPTARALPQIKSYIVAKIDGTLDGKELRSRAGKALARLLK